MNYKKYLPDALHRSNDTSAIVAALIAGVAIGAAIGILFAPDSGAETRTQISDKAKDLAGSVKDKVQAVRETFQSKADDLSDMKDQVVSNVKSKISGASDQANDVAPGA
ncbi:gas vesicle protein [Arcticibacter tournemirensis]|uniref:YtxH domain-containing protein n=1 Tax=Arcticibacter tournemirensis TaxID=699437 RepID=A0A4Q0M8X8_9SPHI|nr:YtxH domain-containing protein [Arcticibacter tournemirensis]KAA8483786.1 YtxH domain-containing protein [Arcticibacter tournemirensis]RXF69638.1 YtxH domain-containing protein [Arcticibacter tournemirensis]TQM50011.1 gas vesicle protein [Arcticibacter tournemirensis]